MTDLTIEDGISVFLRATTPSVAKQALSDEMYDFASGLMSMATSGCTVEITARVINQSSEVMATEQFKIKPDLNDAGLSTGVFSTERVTVRGSCTRLNNLFDMVNNEFNNSFESVIEGECKTIDS